MTKYETIKIADVLTPDLANLLQEIRKDDRISNAENNHCYIAGGFPRILLEKSIRANEAVMYGFNDLDIFLTSKTKKSNLVDSVHFLNEKLTKSPFALNFNFLTSREERISHHLPWKIPVQLIDHESLVKDSIYEILESFDFVNCKIAICGDEFILHPDWFKVSAKNELKISNCNSPFLLRRIRKYSEHYQYKNIEDESIAIINEWFVKAKDNFKNDCKFKNDKELYDLYISSLEKDIQAFVLRLKTIKEIDPSKISNLLFYLGNFLVTKSIWSNYERTTIRTDPVADFFG